MLPPLIKEIRVAHVYREANLCADALSRKGLSLTQETYIFHCCPTFVSHLLEGDLSGVSTPRLVTVISFWAYALLLI